MNELSKIKNCLSVKEKRVNISNSKNRNKCGAKILALMLSAVNLFPGITPYANAADVKEEAKSENSVVRKIKDVGEYVSSLAKREWIEILNFLKGNPKAVTVIATTLVLMTAGTVYREVKSRKELQIVVNENRKLSDEKVELGKELQIIINENRNLSDEIRSLKSLCDSEVSRLNCRLQEVVSLHKKIIQKLLLRAKQGLGEDGSNDKQVINETE